MAEVKYCLKNLDVNKIAELYLDEKFADVKFICKVDKTLKTVPAHKVILALLSPTFKAMFSEEIEGRHVVHINVTRIDAFEEFLQFFYMEKVQLTMKNMKEVARFVKEYDIVEHVKFCIGKFRSELDIENICWAYQLAIFFEHNWMIDSCSNYIKIFSYDIFQSISFCHCDKEVINKILHLNALACSNNELKEACLRWARSTCIRIGIDDNLYENLQDQLEGCVPTMNTNDNTSALQLERYGQGRKRKPSETAFVKIVFKQRSQPYSQKDEIKIVCDSSPWFSDWSYCQFTESSPISRSLSQNPKVLFSFSRPLLLHQLELKYFYCNHRNAFDLNLMVKIFEYDNLTATGVEKAAVRTTIHITPNQPKKARISTCIFINPRKFYKITWRRTNRCFNTFYYDNNTNEIKIRKTENLLVKLHNESNLTNKEQSGIIRCLIFRNLYDLRW